MGFDEVRMNAIQRILFRLFGASTPVAQARPTPSSSDVWLDEDESQWAAKASSYGSNSISSLWLSGTDVGERPFTYPDNPLGWMMAARYNVWAGNCINARANTIASVPLKLYQKSDDPENVDPEEIKDHPVSKLLQRVHPTEGIRMFYRQGGRQLGIHGEWYLLKVRGLDGKPAELHRLPAQWVFPQIASDQKSVIAYQYLGSMAYYPSDIIRVYYPREDYPIYALSPTQTALFSANSYNMADIEQQFRDKRGGQGGGIVSVDGSSAKDWSRIKAEWDSMRSDPRNAGRDAFLPPGATYMSGALSAREQQKEERSGRLAKEIMAAYAVPPSLAGDYSDASVLANASQQSTNFWQTWAIPELEFIAENLTIQLLWAEWPETRDLDYFLGFDLSGIPALQPDRLQEAQVEEVYSRIAGQRITDTLATINEGREYIGLEEVADDRANQLFAVLKSETTPPPDGQGGSQQPPNDGGPSDTTGDGTNGSPSPSGEDMGMAMAEGEGEMDEGGNGTPPPAKALPLDYVGLPATSMAGAMLGRVERVHRFGKYGGHKATKRDPVFKINGAYYPAAAVILQVEG